MNPALLLGIVIGAAFVLVFFGVLLAIPTRRAGKANRTIAEKSLAELIERNSIGHEQLAALQAIAEGLSSARKTRRAPAEPPATPEEVRAILGETLAQIAPKRIRK